MAEKMKAYEVTDAMTICQERIAKKRWRHWEKAR